MNYRVEEALAIVIAIFSISAFNVEAHEGRDNLCYEENG